MELNTTSIRKSTVFDICEAHFSFIATAGSEPTSDPEWISSIAIKYRAEGMVIMASKCGVFSFDESQIIISRIRNWSATDTEWETESDLIPTGSVAGSVPNF